MSNTRRRKPAAKKTTTAPAAAKKATAKKATAKKATETAAAKTTKKARPKKFRLRLQHFLVQPIVVADNGETLRPGPALTTVQLLLPADLSKFADDWPAMLAELQRQLDGAPPPPDPA